MRAKKHTPLGQHFLTAAPIAVSVADGADVSSQDVVLEIGTGKGILTDILLKRGARVIAIEKDLKFFSLLTDRFHDELKEGRLTLVMEDIRSLDLETLKLHGKGYKVVANIPYYLTSMIIRKFLSDTNQPSTMSLLIQKEVAERIVANKGKESILSLAVKVYGTPRIIRRVSRNLFSPPPAVDSAILSITDISKKFFTRTCTEEKFFMLVRAGFSSKRKKLINNLLPLHAGVKDFFMASPIPLNARAEDLTCLEWKKLCEVWEDVSET